LKHNIVTLLDTFNTLTDAQGGSRPGFEATIPNSAFRVANVFAKRVLTRRTLPSGTWKVTQVWDLHVQSPYGDVTAFANAEEIMEREGRLWWEAALQYDGVTELEGLSTTLNEVMQRLDAVGLESVVTSDAKQKRSNRGSEMPYTPFW
jgi:hypothetical protein